MERKKYGLPEEEEERGCCEGEKKENEKEKLLENDQDGEGEVLVEGNTEPIENAEAGPSNHSVNDNDVAAGEDGFDYGNLQRSRFNTRFGLDLMAKQYKQLLAVNRIESDVEEATSGYGRVIESDMTKFVNSGTYGKKLRGGRSREETELFFDALVQYGENHELISIDACLKMRVTVDMQTLSLERQAKTFQGLRLSCDAYFTTTVTAFYAYRFFVKPESRTRSREGEKEG
ncbi:transcription initiation factor bdp1 subunit [Moniliophthora roreri MCA 2997]|uniref:Transcription initiation factor bdp1 subunit n=1 Tax=Moniliophthora roreri (strain MCA 2997) TaxID=1381753 RepID=V2XBD0_MONRO|nr:transcription initiation factor bdp1 subunit [Moniliophthora roreri MCA 2997]